jgi:uncharacterized protein YjdB
VNRTPISLFMLVALVSGAASLVGCAGSGSTTTDPLQLVSITVTPAAPILTKGTALQFKATGIYSDSSTQDLTSTAAWSSSNTAVATILSGGVQPGLATAVSSGTTPIQASVRGVSGSTMLTVPAATLVSIAVSPVNPTLAKGQALQFKATGTYSDTSTQDLTSSVGWSSSDTTVATILSGGSQPGRATAVGSGTTTIQASFSGVSGSTTLTVPAPTLVSIAITPANPLLTKGQTIQFKATGTYSDNSTQDLTSTAAWSSSDTSVATILTGGSQPGFATAVSSGTATIQASVSSISSSTKLTVPAATLVSIAVTPANPSLAAGKTLQFTATGSFSDNSTQDLTSSATWSSSNTAVAAILSGGSQPGLATAVGSGTATIQASVSGISGSTKLTVPAATLVSIAVTPANPSLTKGATLQFKATGTYSDNSTQDLTSTVAWSSSDTAVATILSGGSQPGLATAVGSGTTTIQASLSGVSGSTALTVPAATLVSIAVTPANPSLAAGKTLQFKSTGTYSDNSTQDLTSAAAWTSSDTAVATILSGGSQTGLATAVSSGTTTIQASVSGVSGSTTLTVTAVSAFAGVLTYHNDSSRTGQNLDETVLTPSNVNTNTFGKLFSDPVDGYVYAQPLYVPGVSIAGGTHNVVYVATENDTVYAFDADAAGAPLWQTSLLGPGESPVSDVDTSCGDVGPSIGITSTPVIDPATNTIYLVAKSKLVSGSSTTYFQRLYALDITTGQERSGSPVEITGTAPGTQVAFDPLPELNRPGLALVNGVVYIAFGSQCDVKPFFGWLFGYDAAQLTQIAIFNTTPTTYAGSIWQAGGAPSYDAAGNLYVITANGPFDGVLNWGDSFLKLSLSGNTLAVDDYFAPFNQAELYSNDYDLGSAGALLLPDSVGSAAHPHLLIGAGKQGTIYLLDRDNLGKYCVDCTSTDTQIVQEVQGALTSSFDNFSNPAYFDGMVYFGATDESLRAFSIAGGVLSTSPVSVSPTTFGYPGTEPAVSANGSTNGIVWAIEAGQSGSTSSAVLHAYDATDLGKELYNSAQAANGRDTAGDGVKFTVPTVANGKVYVGTETELDVYGLLP